MPADYQKIREENIARYGWDTAVLDLLGQLYSERTHFIFELIQNAEDAGATELAFELFADRLELRHDGRPFTEADVRGICGVGQSRKSGDLTSIGQFGIGFKSVYAYTRSPHIYSGDEHFRIENYVRPHATDPRPGRRDLVRVPLRSRRRARRGRGPARSPRRWPRSSPASCCSWPASRGCRWAAPGWPRRSSRGSAEVPGGGQPPRQPVQGPVAGRRSGWSGTAQLEGLGAGAQRGGAAPGGDRLPGRGGPDRPAGPRAAERVLPDREGDLPRLPRPGAVPDHAGPGQRARARPGQPGPGARDRRLLADVLRGTA